MERVNLIVGRFQPFTKGHYFLVDAARRQKNLPSVICMILTETPDKKHPFPTTMLTDLYNDFFANDNNIVEVIPVKSADIVKIGALLKEKGYEIASWSCGTDRLDGYSKMANKYHDLAGLSDDFEMIEVPRDEKSEENISATKVRNALLDNDRDTFDALMPEGSVFNMDNMYSTLKDQIEKVYGITQPVENTTHKVENKRYKVKRNLVLEYRIRKLEKLLYEDAFDDELDSLADDYAKDNFSDFEDEFDKETTAIAKRDYRKYNTISEWLDEITEKEKFKDFRPTIGLESAIRNLKRELNSLTISGNKFGLSRTKELQKDIEEISKMTAIKANYKLVKEIQLKLKDFELQREQAYDKLLKDTESLTKYIRSLVPSRLFNITNKKTWYGAYITMRDRNGKLIGTVDVSFNDNGDQNKIYQIASNLITPAGYNDETIELVKNIDEYKDLYIMDAINDKLYNSILNSTLLPCANIVAQTAANNQRRSMYPEVVEKDTLNSREPLTVYAKVMEDGGTMLIYKVTYNNDSDDFTIARKSPRNNFKITSRSIDEIRKAVDRDSDNLY